MPTVMEPKVNKDAKSQPVTPASTEPELFAAEIEMERKSGNFVPTVLILALMLIIGGAIIYFVKSARDVLTVPLATDVIKQVLKAQPATVRFGTGAVPSLKGNPTEPHYNLLAKAGIITTRPKGNDELIVNLNPAGEKVLGEIEGVQKTTKPDKTVTYVVPLAERKLLEVNKITMIKPRLAQVEYTWKWVPNRLGKEFDASGGLVKSFSTWDRSTLIKSYGVDFYDAAPTKASIVLLRENDGSWTPYKGY